jgi:hypothetical protein
LAGDAVDLDALSIWRWIVKTANRDKANKKELKKFIKEEL